MIQPEKPLVHDVYTRPCGCLVLNRWTIPPESAAFFRKLARAFNMSVPEFLEAFSKRELPGQPKKMKMPRIQVTLDGGDLDRVGHIARRYSKNVTAYVRETVKSSLANDLTEIVWHPTNGKPLTTKVTLEKFCSSQVR